MILINLIRADELVAYNYLLNLSAHEFNKNISKNLIIKCIENKNENENEIENQNQNNNYAFNLWGGCPDDILLNLCGSLLTSGFNMNLSCPKCTENFPFFEEEKVAPYEKRFFSLFKINKFKFKKKEIKNNPKYKKNYR